MASEGVLRHVHPLGDSPRHCLADGGACVPKVLPAAELEGILAGLIIAVALDVCVFIGSGPGPVRDFGTERALVEPLGPNTGNFPNLSPQNGH